MPPEYEFLEMNAKLQFFRERVPLRRQRNGIFLNRQYRSWYHPARVLRKRRVPTAGVPCDRMATARTDLFAIAINEATIGVVAVDLERGAPEWKQILEPYGR